MTKQELIGELVKLKKEKIKTNNLLEKICKEAIEQNCDDALPYVNEINEVLGLNIALFKAVKLDMELPVHIFVKYMEHGLGASDIELSICGQPVYVNGIGDMEDY